MSSGAPQPILGQFSAQRVAVHAEHVGRLALGAALGEGRLDASPGGRLVVVVERALGDGVKRVEGVDVVYHAAAAKLTDPARELPPTTRRVLAANCASGLYQGAADEKGGRAWRGTRNRAAEADSRKD